MRLIVGIALALAVGACSKPENGDAQSKATGESPTPVAAAEQAAPAPPAEEALPVAAPPETTAAPAPSAPAAKAAPRPNYAARERRLTALIANGIDRDPNGDVEYEAERARAERARCATSACVERSYARQEARLRQFEGADDIR